MWRQVLAVQIADRHPRLALRARAHSHLVLLFNSPAPPLPPTSPPFSGLNPALGGRGLHPVAFRKIPQGAFVEVTASFSGLSPTLPNWRCGAVVFNGGTNSSLFSVGLVQRGVAAQPTLEVWLPGGAGPLAVAATRSDSTAWTASGPLVLRVLRVGTGSGANFTVAARPSAIPDSWGAWTNLTVSPRDLQAFVDADLWYGVELLGWGGSASSSAAALFTGLRIAVPVPATPPRDLFNAVDVCVDAAGIRRVVVSVGPQSTSAVLRGLSGFFPYTLTVVGVEAGTLSRSFSSPLPGLYFYPRRMPPRSHKLGLWLDSRSIPAGALARWPDSSMRGHDLVQPDSTRRPTVSAGNLYATSTPNFRRTAAHYMVSGSDVFDLGIAGNFTAYLQLRGTQSTPQVVMGRGGPATVIKAEGRDHVGWAAVVYNELLYPYPGYLGIKVADGFSSPGGSKKDHFIANTGYGSWYDSVPIYTFTGSVLPRDNPTADPNIPPTGLFTTAAKNGDARVFMSPGLADVAVGNNVTGLAGMAWYAGPNGTAVSSPQISPDTTFRIGGPASASLDTRQSFDGDLWQILLYRESHDAATVARVSAWMQDYGFGRQCTQNIATANTNSGGAQCTGMWGYGSLRCWQDCKSGFQWFMGNYHDHWCSNGAWDRPALNCKKGCGDAIPPLYVASCKRTIVADSFDDPAARTLYFNYPSLPHPQAERVWSYARDPLGSGTWMQANPTYTDACARMGPVSTVLGFGTNRWNDIYLPWGSKAWFALSVMVETDNSTAGLAFRISDANTMYRVAIRTGSISLIRVTGGRPVTIRSAPGPFVPWVWYNLEAVYERTNIAVVMNNVTLLSISDPGGPNWGSVGLYAEAGPARFANLSINSTCDMFNQARNMAAGMRVSYECKKGYEVVGNTTWICGADGTYGGRGLVCKSLPPVFGNYTFGIEEHSANGTTIGVASATPANPEQLLGYSLVAQYPFNATLGFAFSVVGCSGAIRVYDPYQLDYQAVRQFNLTIMAVPDNQLVAASFTNVTINIINVVDPPVLLPTVVTINETLAGPVSSPIGVWNPDKFTLKYSIGAGDTSSRFTIDPDTGLIYVKPPGLLYADSQQYDLLINAIAQEDMALQSSAVLSVQVVDIDTAPTLNDEVFYMPEGMVQAGQFIGIVPASDVDVNPAWNVLTLDLTVNAFLSGPTRPLFGLDNATGALFFAATKTYAAGDMVYWYGDRKARDIFDLTVTACDNGGACTSSVATVVVLATNVSDLTSLITGISSPANGMKTDGGEIVKFLGKDFPPGAVVTAQYGSTALGALFPASGCFVKDFGTIQCTTSPGYGASLTWKVFINAFQVPTTAALVSSYGAPVIYSVDVDTVGLSTSGSALAAVTIKGENFGPANAPVTIRYGSGPALDFIVPSINSVAHTTIKATLGPGCGSDLAVTVIVGGQTSTNLPGVTPVISYPQPAISAITVPSGMPYTLSTLPTTDLVDLVLTGTNFGPDLVGASALPLTPAATYTGPQTPAYLGQKYTYGAVCRKDDVAQAHTRMLCRLAPGVSFDLAWSVDVCGQASAPAATRTSYAAPVLSRISGPGASRASTEGGQNVLLNGDNFGPTCCDLTNPATIASVRYGDPGLLQYTAQGCRVTSTTPAQIACLTGPGTGRDHVWQIDVGGQASAVLVANTSYSPPVIYNFLGTAADYADTRGYENVTIVGAQFGDRYDPLLVSVTYTDQIQGKSDFTGVLPGSPPGVATYTPPWCVMSTPHKALTCGLRPGGGVGINWVVVVDRQVSTAPTTAFGLPAIATLTIVGGKPAASTDGGDVVDIRGVNFGIPSLLQRISFGPTGTEYRIAGNLSVIQHDWLQVTLGPAISLGSPMRFLVAVADQVSELSVATLTMATPTITSVTPATADGEVDAGRPTIITVRGYEFGLLDPTADVAIAFGNAADNTLLSLLAPVSRTPTIDDISSPTWVRPAAPILHTLTFALPAGLGKQRAIKVVPYRRGSAPSLASVAALASQGAAATFSFIDPFVDYIVVSPVVAVDEVQLALVLFGGNLNGTDVAQLRRLDIRGRYFGPAQEVNRDSVLRIVEEQTTPGVFSATAFRVANWTHRLVTAYSFRSQATVRVRIVAKDPAGSDIAQASGMASYSDVSPSVDGIVGTSTGFPTAGGGIVSFKAGGLGSCVVLNVTVGGRRCTLVDAPVGGQPFDETDARAKIILAQGSPPFTPSFQWTISCVVPEGQGSAAIVLIRDGVKSADGVGITYAPPTISKVGSWSQADGAYRLAPFVPATSVLTAPTESWGVRTVRIEGDNFGVCPVLLVAIDSPIFVDACIETPDPVTGAPVLTPNPDVVRTHTYIEFVAPDGEGSGVDVSPPRGWTVLLSAGGQPAVEGSILFRYEPPTVTVISPSFGPTRGHTASRPQILTLAVRNIGKRVPSVALGSSLRTYMPCTGVVRVSNTTLTCELPEGSGNFLRARVTVADLSGYGGEFNYTQPTISAMTLATASTDPLTNITTYVRGLSIVPSATASVPPPTLLIPTLPDFNDVLIIDGDSFGPHDPSDNCVFVAWSQRAAYAWGPGSGTPPPSSPLTCIGNVEDFLGEGQVPDASVIEYGHDRVVIRLPPGSGDREVTLRAGSQAPPEATAYASLRYREPVITGPLVGLTELSTDGGGRSRIPATNVPRMPFSFHAPGAPTSLPVGGGGGGNGSTTPPAGINLYYPYPLPLPDGFQPPTEHVVVRLGPRCLTSAYDVSGRRPSGTDRCIPDSVLAIDPSPVPAPTGTGGLTFLVPPGVGVNKSVVISVISNGVEIASSNVGSFSYDPPVITRVDPSPVYQRLDTPRTFLSVAGKNFGRLQDMSDWTDEERTTAIFVTDVECLQAERIVRLGADMVQCQLTLGVPVGHRNVSIIIGGQAGSVPERDPRGIFIVCSQGLYGMVGESCAACPRGATCKGFIPDEQVVRDSGVNVSLGAVRDGRIQYDIGGIHTYPIPVPGFFNLNGSMASACPPGMTVPGRDVCIVPCMPTSSCLEDNICAEAYTSKAPMYRCASCAKGFYRRDGECERCPQNAAAQFIILILVAMTAAAAAFWMNKFNINPAFISIGLDYFQVIAIFAQSKVPWPKVIKDLFYILSAFNLNLEILAPECLLPDVTFQNKFASIISLPIIVYLLFGGIHALMSGYKRFVKQQEWLHANSHLPGLISASLLLLYIFYLYVTKTILDVFNCVPTEPPDGKLYLAAVFEECWVPGGAHLTLYPYAILAVIAYTIGYPAFLAQLTYRRRDLIMEDQYLRAKGAGDSRLENPHAYDFRRTFSRIYYQFKPEYYWWILAILIRKFCIAFTTLMFGRNVGFQMAACLLVLFLAYAAQVRYSPFMSPDEHESVIRRLLQLSASSKLHNRLRATLAQVESAGRKKGRTNKLMASSKFTAVSALYYIAGILFNYNFVDATLLFSACIVNLCGLLYQTARPEDTFYAASRDGITGVVLAVIAVSVLYWAVVVAFDISSQFTRKVEERARGRAREKIAKRKAKTKKSLVAEGAKLEQRMPSDIFTRGLGGKSTAETTQVNPMFTKKDTGAAIVTAEQAHGAIMDMQHPPDQLIWDMFRSTYNEQFGQIKALRDQLNASKAEVVKLQETIENAGLSGLLYDSSRVVLDAYRTQGGARGGQRRQFEQTAIGAAFNEKKKKASKEEDEEEAELDRIMGRTADSDSEAEAEDEEDGGSAKKPKRFSISRLAASAPKGEDAAAGTGVGSKRASARLGALFGLGGDSAVSSAPPAAGGAPGAKSGGGWRGSLRMTGFSLKNISAMVSAGGDPDGDGTTSAHTGNAFGDGLGPTSVAPTVAPSRSGIASFFGGGSVIKSGGSVAVDSSGADFSVGGSNPLGRQSMMASPLAVARGPAQSSSSNQLRASASTKELLAALAANAQETPANVPAGRGTNKKRLAGKVVAGKGGEVGSDAGGMIASPMAGGGGSAGKAESALKGFKAKYGAALDA
jgi:hypothetical protein